MSLLPEDDTSGLLGGGVYQDPRSLGLLALASGLLSASGASRTPVTMGQALGGGLNQAIATNLSSRKVGAEEYLNRLRGEMYKQEVQDKKDKAELMKKAQAWMAQDLASMDASSSEPDRTQLPTSGQVNLGNSEQTMSGEQRFLPTQTTSNPYLEAYAARNKAIRQEMMGAVTAGDMGKYLALKTELAKPIPVEIGKGYMSPSGQLAFTPKLDTGMIPGPGGSITMAPGATNAISQATLAQEVPKTVLGASSAAPTLLRGAGPGGSDLLVDPMERFKANLASVQQILGNNQPQAPAPTPVSAPTPAPVAQPRPSVDKVAILNEELAKEKNLLTESQIRGNVKDIALHIRNISAINQEISKIEKQPSGKPSNVGPGITQVGITEGEKASAVERAQLGAKAEQEVIKAGQDSVGKLQQLAQAKDLLAKVPTGPLYPVISQVSAILGQFGVETGQYKNVPNVQAVQSILNRMALTNRNPAGGAGMPGSLSDADRVFLLQTVPNIKNVAKANQILFDILMGAETNAVRRGQFVSNMRRDGLSSDQINEGLAQFDREQIKHHLTEKYWAEFNFKPGQ